MTCVRHIARVVFPPNHGGRGPLCLETEKETSSRCSAYSNSSTGVVSNTVAAPLILSDPALIAAP